MDYSSTLSLPTIITERQKVDDDLKYDDEEKQLQTITVTGFRPEVERLPSFTEVCN